MSEEVDILEIIESMRSNHSVKPVSRNRSLLQMYIFYRLEGNADPLKSKDSFRRFVQWTEESDLMLDLMRRISRLTDKKETVEIHKNPCDLAVGLSSVQNRF